MTTITMKKKPRAPRVGDVWVRPCPDGSEEEVRIAHVFNDGIQLTNGDYCGTAFEACGWRPVTGPRAPQVGDVWVDPEEGFFIHIERIEGGGVWIHDHAEAGFIGGSGEPEAIGIDWIPEHFTLVATGARTLAEREAAGELPDITEDDRTPLERMTADRDALRAERDNMRGAYQRLQARMVVQIDAALVIDPEVAETKVDLAEALDALRGMVRGTCMGAAHDIDTRRVPRMNAALTVLAKHGIVENWDGRYADWADDAQEVAG